jgi:hypothetical protein
MNPCCGFVTIFCRIQFPLRVLDQAPYRLLTSSGSDSGSDPKYSLFHNVNHLKGLRMAF